MHKETKVTHKENQIEIKVDEVNGIRRNTVLHVLLTERESRLFDQTLSNALFNINVGRGVLTQEERAKLPQPAAKKPDKTEAME